MHSVIRKSVSVIASIALAMVLVFAVTLIQPVEQAEAATPAPALAVTRAATGKVVLKEGASYKLAAKASKGTVTYKSSKKKTVTISKKGVLKARKAGKAVITVTAKKGSKKAVKQVRVQVVKKSKYKQVKKITLKATSKKIEAGSTAKVKVSFKPSKASNKNVTFKSSNTSVATVSPTGTVTAKRAGTVKITATSCANSKAKSTVKITVTSRTADDVREVDYSSKTQAVSALDAKVSTDGKTAKIDQAALSAKPVKGQIIAIADDDLQGTAIKVTSVTLNSDGTYTVKGTKPEFDEVFDKVELADEEECGIDDMSWVADGVEVEEADASELSPQASGTETLGTLKFIFTKEFFKKASKNGVVSVNATGNFTIAITPIIDYNIKFSWGNLKRFKVVFSQDTKFSFDGKVDGKAEIPFATFNVGVAEATAYMIIGVDGKVTVATRLSTKLGIDYTKGVSGSPIVADAEMKGSLSFAATARLGISANAKVGLLGFDMGTLKAEGGGKARYTLQHASDTLICADVSAWGYAEASYKVDKLIAKPAKIDATAKWELLNEKNSPLLWEEHLENGEPVDECTWTDPVDPEDPDPGEDPVDPAPQDGDIASGTVGTCSWHIDAAGCLTVGAGTLPSNDQDGAEWEFWPWHKYSEQVKSVRFDSEAKLSGSAAKMFSDCRNLTDISGLSSWDTSAVTDMADMFFDCNSLSNLSALSGWDVSSVTDMDFMLSFCTSLSDLSALSGWDVSAVTDMGGMFSYCGSLSDLTALEKWDVSAVTDMAHMFVQCASLSDLSPLSGWDVSAVESTSSIFNGCTSLSDLSPLSGWDVSAVTDMSHMFMNCTPLSDLSPLSGWDVSAVTNMSYMFYLCSSLTDASCLDNWTANESLEAWSMFDDCAEGVITPKWYETV